MHLNARVAHVSLSLRPTCHRVRGALQRAVVDQEEWVGEPTRGTQGVLRSQGGNMSHKVVSRERAAVQSKSRKN